MKRTERLYAIQWRERGGWCWATDYPSVDYDRARVAKEIRWRRSTFKKLEYRLVTMRGEWRTERKK